MSRSFRKVPYRGACADSDKACKVKANRLYRRLVKSLLKTGETELPHKNTTSDVYDFRKDGKTYCGDMVFETTREYCQLLGK